MQVSDLLFQYQNNLATGTEISTGTKGIEQLVETAKQLEAGSIFEGTVNSIKGTQVILGLSSGQNIAARLDKGITLTKGQSVFFQVKSNDGNQVQIKPISLGGNAGNPTLMKALDAASLPVNEKNLNMVNAMMKEQMSIDVKSLQDMSRQVLQIPGADPTTVVEMTKLDIPLTESNVNQFQNYKADAGEVLAQIQQLVEDIPSAVSGETVSVKESVAFQQQIISFFAGAAEPQGEVENTRPSDPMMTTTSEGAVVQAATDEVMQKAADETIPEAKAGNQGIIIARSNEDAIPGEYPKGSVGEAFPEKAELANFQKAIDAFPAFAKQHPQYFTADKKLSPDVPVKEFMVDLARTLQSQSQTIEREDLKALVNHKGYKNLLSRLITEQWTIEPEQLKQEHSVRDLYQRMEQQLHQLQEVVSKYPKANETVSNALKNLSQNIDFMNQINQAYSYVQIPVRLQHQNVNSELFVYRNNKESKGEDEPLSAFLHFDMDHLGGMDISVRMHHKNVQTNWYLDRKETLDLISDNIHLLEAKLEAKGYHCEMKFSSESNKTNFVEDFLKADEKTGGEVHRYSFDVRA